MPTRCSSSGWQAFLEQQTSLWSTPLGPLEAAVCLDCTRQDLASPKRNASVHNYEDMSREV